MNKRILAASAMLGLLASYGSPNYGINTNPGSIDTFFTTVGKIGGGSGTIIAPNWVLTARHVTGNFELEGVTYIANQRLEHPTSDLALLHFNTPFSNWTPLVNANPLGMQTNIVGYGHSAEPRADHTGYTQFSSFGTRRTVTNTIGISMPLTVQYNFGALTFQHILSDLDSSDPLTPAPYTQDWFGDGGATSNEGNVAGGDSGGGWLVFQGGQWRIAGVTTVAIAIDTVPPGANETQGSKFFAYGMSGSGAADLWDPTNRNWVLAAVPEPTTMAVFGIGIAALLRRRRK